MIVTKHPHSYATNVCHSRLSKFSLALCLSCLMSSCDSNSGEADPAEGGSAETTQETVWIPQGALVKNLPICDVAINPPKVSERPEDVIEIIIDQGICKVVGPLKTTEHGPIATLENMTPKDNFSNNPKKG